SEAPLLKLVAVRGDWRRAGHVVARAALHEAGRLRMAEENERRPAVPAGRTIPQALHVSHYAATLRHRCDVVRLLFRAARLLKRSEGIEIAAVEPLSIDRELPGPVAEALGELPEAPDAVLALAAHLLEVDLDGNDLLAHVAAEEHAPRGIEHGRMTIATGSQSIDVEHIALHHRRGGMRHGEIDVAIDGVRQHGMQDDLRTHGRDLPRRLPEPHIVAVEHPQTAHLGNVEHEELGARPHALLHGHEREHLAIAPDDGSVGTYDGGGIIDCAFLALVH